MSEFLSNLKEENNITQTLNGAYTYKSTLNECLDLFFQVGAFRNADEKTIQNVVMRSYINDKDLTLRILFFARDVRGGLGERRVFKVSMRYLAKKYPQSIVKNLGLFPEYGRWDDLLCLYDIPQVHCHVVKLIGNQLTLDIKNMKENKKISLLAKWLPSVNASNKDTVILAKRISKDLQMDYKYYRQMLSSLRKHIDIIENRLRIKDYSFDYSKQPSRAMLIYREAFIRNDVNRYRNYLESVSKGESKLNVSTIYPYDIVRSIINSNYISEDDVNSLDTMWKSLPNITNNRNSIVVIDGSGSMRSGCNQLKPCDVALSLGLYFAEHSNGKFANHFITFSETPKLIEVKGSNIVEKVDYILQFDEIANTNLQGVFDLILNTAVKNNLPQQELPSTIYIISDMEFDSCVLNGDDNCTNFEVAKIKYENSGYNLPNVVFWNVNSKTRQVPVKAHQSGAILISGASANIFNMVQSGDFSPQKIMLDILSNDRYKSIYA